jgi:type IV fimbrial biogenesis protein FimT
VAKVSTVQRMHNERIHTMRRTASKPSFRRQAGLSLVELMIALSVTAVAAGAALPNFGKAIEQRRMDAVAAELKTDIQHARSLAVALNQNVRITHRSSTAGTCYIVHTGPATDCSCNADGSASCGSGAVVHRSVLLPADGPVAVQSNVQSMVLDAAKATVSPAGTWRVVGRDARTVQVVVNIMGRTRMCASGAATAGYPSCN